MTVRLRRWLPLFLAGALFGTLVSVAIGTFGLGTKNVRETSRSKGTPVVGLRPTGVGLPMIGVEGTVGVGDYAEETRGYHDSGAYARDVAVVGRRAFRYVVKRSRRLRREARGGAKPKLGVVFDIDETSLSNYECLQSFNFAQATAALATCVIQASGKAIVPTRRIWRYATRHGIRTYFITGRPDAIPGARDQTEMNMRAEGYTKWTEMVLAPSIDFDTIEYKTGERARIERGGVDIIANVGDQESDLAGGHADRAYKYPNPFYYIGE
ncbi:MAG TPA: HAD family acid phosphatase [Solirubrobacterales bacterium]|nr:HAD family acid phosphatase [Solirubrobacterales bacterium]